MSSDGDAGQPESLAHHVWAERVDARAELGASGGEPVIGEGDRGSRHSRVASRPRSCIKALMRLAPAAEISLTDILHQWAA